MSDMSASGEFRPTKDWTLAGKAIFTVHNATGESYTFRVARSEEDARKLDPRTGKPYPTTYFVGLLTGPENETDYTYLGILSGADSPAPWCKTTKASRFTQDSKPVAVVRWALGVIWNGGWDRVPAGYGIHGAGRCGRCGRTLTRPEGVDPGGFRYGFGPECWDKMVGGVEG